MTLKLITLNIWGGHVEKPLLQFIKHHQAIDVFCFQEVYYKATEKISTEDRYHHLDIFSELAALLPNHHGYFRPVVNGIYGIGMFIKKNIQILDEGEVIVHTNPEYIGRGPAHDRILQYAHCRHHHFDFSVINFHGLWNGKGKTDSPERILQSQKMRAFIDTIPNPKIICGDFNLAPGTESLKMIGDGMVDHIALNHIQSTRTSFYEKAERFADYVFTSPDVLVKNFQVLPDEVSDHAPLLIEFSA